ncbi:hypothetical protein MJO29_006445 [Puccinia striiformis f. sp. tritici]|nr:hypothetical protein MJO29_006445 [Puccinia striiformis f. sp. tritici]
MNSFVIDPTLIKFKGPNYARFCGKFTISTPGASPLLVFVRLLLGWNYCHVDQAINAFEGSRIAYVGSMQGRDKGDGTPIVEVPKATLNFVGGMLDRGEECLETELSDDFN